MKTYNFGTHWITTEEPLTGHLDSFDISPEELVLIDSGASLEVIDGILIIGLTE
jgi:hypothetical protein